MTLLRRSAARLFAAMAIVLAVTSVTTILIVRSGWFRERVRERIVFELERATGGRAELVSLVTLGLRLISMLERRVDLASLRVDQPHVYLAFYPDGSTNLPTPTAAGEGIWTQNLLNLAVGRYELHDGLMEYDFQKVPFDLQGEDLQVEMKYQAKGPRYQGDLSSRHLRILSERTAPVEIDFAAAFALEADRVTFSRIRLETGHTSADLAGALTELRKPKGTFTTKAKVAIPDVVAAFSLPLDPVGSATFDGDLAVNFTGGFGFTLAGRASAEGIGYSHDRLRIEGARANAMLHVTPDRITLRSVDAVALGARFDGQVDFNHGKELHVEGNFADLGVREAVHILTPRPIAWNGVLTGTAEVDAILGEAATKAHVTAVVAPLAAAAGTPIEGQVETAYDQRAGTLQLDKAHMATTATSVDVSGTLSNAGGAALDLRVHSTHPDDFLPAWMMFDPNAPSQLPVQLDRGDASVAGSISGTLDAPRFRGQVALNRPVVMGHPLTRITSDVDAAKESVTLRRLALTRGPMTINGDVTLAGVDGNAPLTAQANVRNAPIGELAKEFGVTTPLSGTASATVRLSGTLQRLEGEAALDITQAAAFGEQFPRLRANVGYTAKTLTVTGGQADLEPGTLRLAGAYNHPENDWNQGDARVDVNLEGVHPSKIAMWRDLQVLPDAKLDARLEGKASLQGRVEAGQIALRVVNGDVAVRGITMYGQPLGEVTLTAATRNAELSMAAKGQLRGAAVQTQGIWRMLGDYPGEGTVRLSRITMASLYDLVMLGSSETGRPAPPPFDGFLEASATFKLSLLKPGDFSAEVAIPVIQANARASQALRLDVQSQDVNIHNTDPILLSISRTEARIRAARFTARETNLEVTGRVPFGGNASGASPGADLSVKGAVNLAVLQLLNPDLLARGSATVAASIRGSVRDPQLNGRMELNGASLYMNDVPNGIDNASGVILFDRNRATIDRLTAQTGGGTVSLGGFLEFGEPLIYRLRADVKQVRVRYPEDVSTTADAQLQLTGTSEASTVSGTLTLVRAAISANADFGRILARNSAPSVGLDTPNDYLRGLRMDVHIENAPTFAFETSLTRNVQAAVDLRLRGSPARPILSGDISVNSGELQLFGNRYTVNRGDIRFLNPVRIEPTLDMNLETKARGITVTISISGTPERLNVNYSSDPPLQSREIIALLAVGRDPSASTSLAPNQLNTSAGFGDAGGLLGEAVAQQLSNRLQRFFGASRVKIDPTLTGIESLPQARLTLEQQVSRDITLTYITNLNRTQEQIVQVQWDLSSRWSAIAIRKANGLFGVDFQYRKRF